MIIDCAVYEGGIRHSDSAGPAEAAAHVLNHDGFAWIAIKDPTPEEIVSIGEMFGMLDLRSLAKAATSDHPKVEHHGDFVAITLRSAQYLDAPETVEFGQTTIVVSRQLAMVTRTNSVDVMLSIRQRFESNPEFSARGTGAVLQAALHEAVSEYAPVLDGLENDVGEVEDVVFGDSDPTVIQRIYFLLREVLAMQRTITPLRNNIERVVSLHSQHCGIDFRSDFVDIDDEIRDIAERVLTTRQLLNSAFEANATQVSLRQNEDMRKMSAWAALLAIPTMIAGIYGMNFDVMPELDVWYGYPGVLTLMVVACAWVYRLFKKSGWL